MNVDSIFAPNFIHLAAPLNPTLLVETYAGTIFIQFYAKLQNCLKFSTEIYAQMTIVEKLREQK